MLKKETKSVKYNEYMINKKCFLQYCQKALFAINYR